MEVQSPFQIKWENATSEISFAEFLLSRVQKYMKTLALVDAETGRQWRYNDLKPYTAECIDTLKGLGVTANTRVALVCTNTPDLVVVHLACGLLGITCACLNPLGTADELWHQIDLSEASFVVTQSCFMQRMEDVKKKAAVRGGGKLKRILLLEEVVLPPTAKSLGTPKRATSRQRERRSLQNDLAVRQPTRDRRASATPTLNIAQLNGGSYDGAERRPPDRSFSAVKSSPSVTDFSPIQSDDDMVSSTPPTVMSPRAGSPSPTAPQAQRRGPPADGARQTPTKTAAGAAANRPSLPSFLIFFSSGTTGLPKPIEVKNQCLIINLQQLSAPHFGPPTAKDRLLCYLDMFHIYGVVTAYYGLYNGCTVVTMPKTSSSPEFFQVIQDYKISYMNVVPSTVHMLAKSTKLSNFDLTGLKSITSAGAPLDYDLAVKCCERLKLKDLRQSFGITEACGAVTWSNFGSRRLTSVGVPLPGMLIKVVQVDTRQLRGPNEPGELCVKGPQVITSIYKNTRSTQELIDSDGYLKTGDMAYYDNEGYIYVTDRIKDMIKYKGSSIVPSELEALLRSHPSIADCAVVGRPDHVAGEVPAAFVVRSSVGGTLTTADVRNYVQSKTPGVKELRGGVFFAAEVPRTGSGKVQRKQLRQQWDRERAGAPANKADAVKERDTARKESTGSGGNRSKLSTASERDKNSLNKSSRAQSSSNLSRVNNAKTGRRVV